jgi:DNA repair protein RadC
MLLYDQHPLRKVLQTRSDNELLLTAFGYNGPIPSLGELFGFHPPSCEQVNAVNPAAQLRFFACTELMARALASHMREAGPMMSNPSAVRAYLQLQLGGRSAESFAVLWLDSQNRLITYEEIFRGTLNQTSVYPRELVRSAMEKNAASVVLAHNHPSGVAEPSGADERLTQTLKAALALVDVRVLDHFIVTPDHALSMAEKGLV